MTLAAYSTAWTCALELDAARRCRTGSEGALGRAIGAGADLRIGTEFVYNEHLDVASENSERVQEVAEFGVTYLLNNEWVAAVMNLRQPVNPPEGFHLRPSMSFFLYNQNGQQAIARPHMDGTPALGEPGASPLEAPPDMPKYHALDNWDGDTNSPSGNFIYDFEVYRFFVSGGWREVLSHDADGVVRSGSVADLAEAVKNGCDLKVGVRNLCADLATESDALVDHEVFVRMGSSYHCTERGLFSAETHPVVRIRPAVPLRYESKGWDFGWLLPRTDGRVAYRRCDPYTLAFADVSLRCALRWFVR